MKLCRLLRRGLPGLLAVLGLAACGGGGGGLEPVWVDTQIEVVDLDGDGLAEVVTLATWMESYESKTGHLKVYRQTAPGVFAAALDHVLPHYPWRFVVVDVDGDGRPDIVATHPDLQQLPLLRQDPARPAAFLPAESLAVVGRPYRAVIGDFDGDGRADIVASGSPLTLLRQDPARPGRFLAPQTITVGHGAGELVAADFDADGRLDLAAAGGDQVSVLLQRAGGFSAPVLVGTADGGRTVQYLAAIDLDADGRRDLLFTYSPNDSGDTQAAEVALLLRDAAPGSFRPPVRTGRATAAFWGYAAGDLDGDGLPDLAQGATWPVQGGLRHFVGIQRLALQPAPALTGVVDIAMPAPVEPVAIGDVSGDGRADVLAFGDDLVWVLRQRSTPFSFEAPMLLR